MKVKCKVCGEEYHDEVCWTICPHNPLDRAADAVYCKKHDLFECHLCTHAEYQKARKETLNAVNKCENQYKNDLDKVVATLQLLKSRLSSSEHYATATEVRYWELRSALNIPTDRSHEDAIKDAEAIYRSYYNS